jgi:hypothetical protein
VGGGESCHEMAWGGLRGGPCLSIYSHGGGIRGEDEESYEENICRDLKIDSEGISEEENIWRIIGGILGQYLWKELEGDYWGNIWAVFLERI